MSDIDDSFIVLEETPSMLQFSLLDTSISNNEIDTNSMDKSLCTIDINPILLSTSSLKVADQTKDTTNDFSPIAKIPAILPVNNISTESVSNNIDKNRQQKQTSLNTTLAQSFLLGDINCDRILKSIGNSNQKDDVEKWQSLIQERNDLKDALKRTNATMRQQYSMVNNWQNSVKDLKENHETELTKFRNINDELFHQNFDLQAKVAELQQLAELSRKTCLQNEQTLLMTEKLEKEQLEKQIQSLKLELANTIAMNVEIEEAHQETKGQLKSATAEIANLKKRNESLQRELDETKALETQYREKASVIQTQCDVFRNDFELERKQREEMACERDQMIADIKMLKKRNQALIDEAQSYYTETSATSLTSNGNNSTVSIEDNNNIQTFICPLCSNGYEKLNDLESHVQSCLENN